VILFESEWELRYVTERNPNIKLATSV